MLELKETFKKEVYDLKDYLLFLVVDSKSYQKTSIDVTKYLVSEQNIPGVYVTLNKPYDVVKRDLASNNIDTRLIIFIDVVTITESKRAENCLFIGSPEKLSDMSVAIDQAIKAIPTSNKFLIFDSLNTLGIFNKPATLARFVHFLAAKIREWKVKGVILTLGQETDPAVIDELEQFSDATVEVGGET